MTKAATFTQAALKIATCLGLVAWASGPVAALDEDVDYGDSGWTYDGPQPDADGVLVINGCRLEPKTSCPGVDLRHADLSGLDLFGANFRGAKLARADFTDTNLKFANLDGADLKGATLVRAFMQKSKARGADMRAANFEYARVSAADWSGADLTAANLEMVRANKLQLKGADLSSANLQEMKLYDSNLSEAIMDDGTVITFAIFQDAYMEGCRGCPFDW